MSSERETARIVRSWLEEGVTRLPDRVLDSVLDQLPATPQRRLPWPARRFAQMDRRFSLLAGAAAAVVVLGLVGLNLVGTGGVGGGPTGGPSVGPTASPTVAASPVALVQADHPIALKAGAYVVGAPFPVKLAFTLPARWQGNVGGPYLAEVQASAYDYGIYFQVLGNVYADPCHREAGLATPSMGPSVDDLVGALTHLKGVTATAPTATTFAGYPATTFDLTAAAATDACTGGVLSLWELPLGARADLPGGQRTRVTVLTVGGTRLLVEVDESAGETAAQKAEVQGVLDSLTIQP